MERDAVILGGGNMGDVASRLEAAERLISERIGTVTSHSAMHRSRAWGFEADDFTNRAFVVRTAMPAEGILDALQQIERELGRDRDAERREKSRSGQAYASRGIDLDILMVGDERIDTERLRVPHPRMLQREFAMVPASEATGIPEPELRQMIENMERR